MRKTTPLKAALLGAAALLVVPAALAATIVGTPRADSPDTGFIGTSLDDRMFGRGGNDIAQGGAGNDRIHGNSGQRQRAR